MIYNRVIKAANRVSIGRPRVVPIHIAYIIPLDKNSIDPFGGKGRPLADTWHCLWWGDSNCADRIMHSGLQECLWCRDKMVNISHIGYYNHISTNTCSESMTVAAFCSVRSAFVHSWILLEVILVKSYSKRIDILSTGCIHANWTLAIFNRNESPLLYIFSLI